MIREIIKLDIGQIVEIGEYHLAVEYNMDRITKTVQGIMGTIEVTLEEKIYNPQLRIIEVDTEGIIETLIMKEVGVDLGIDNIQIIPEWMIEVAVGLDHDQEPVPIEIELDAINVENMIISLRTVWPL